MRKCDYLTAQKELREYHQQRGTRTILSRDICVHSAVVSSTLEQHGKIKRFQMDAETCKFLLLWIGGMVLSIGRSEKLRHVNTT